jgi:hypothetical protein
MHLFISNSKKMKNLKKIGLKILGFILLLVLCNYVYKISFWEKDLQTHSEIINDIRKVSNNHTDVVYLGESSNHTLGRKDTDKRKISEMIAAYFPSLKFGEICQNASHANMYYHFLRSISEESDVKTVIVTMNLRSFDAGWIYSNLETPLLKGLVLLKKYPPLFNRFLLSFKGYEIKTDKEREEQFLEACKKDKLNFPYPFPYQTVRAWDDAMAIRGFKNPDGTRNQFLTELACHYIKAYAFQINTATNPRIKDFDAIVSLSEKRKWNVIFNLLGENIEAADSLVGKELIWLMKQNRDLLIKRYRKKKVLVIDNLMAIPATEFVDTNWTTEHYAQSGRRIIAKNVAYGLRKYYWNSFKNKKV